MRVGYIGNFEPEHSTENHVKTALETNGHEVRSYQENHLGSWDLVQKEMHQLDFVLWTRTGWEPPIAESTQLDMLRVAHQRGVPTVGYHLDRWWGLKRQSQVSSETFFKCDLVCTADGGHEDRFASVGVNHAWFRPGVSASECLRESVDRPEFKHDVVFCGSWQSYHPEWKYRMQLVRWLRRTYPKLGLYPLPGEHALRGQDLVDLYGNCKVIVGDSCLYGNQTHYWSDRIPETLGRNGFLIHPAVEGMEDSFRDGVHLRTYELGNYRQLKELIDQYVQDDDARKEIAREGKIHVLAAHTYEVRMHQLVGLLKQEGML